MSLINDALKQARQAPPRSLPNALPSLQPVADEPASTAVWVIPAIVIFLIVAAIFFIGWAAAHNTVRTIVATPGTTTQDDDTVVMPVVVAPILTNPAAMAPSPVLPKLQGIFYSPTAPTAILDGKTVSPGDQFNNFQVKAITKYTVTLIGPDKKEYEIDMDE